jgi:hypothetical protein
MVGGPGAPMHPDRLHLLCLFERVTC